MSPDGEAEAHFSERFLAPRTRWTWTGSGMPENKGPVRRRSPPVRSGVVGRPSPRLPYGSYDPC
jgi:hypothetical protein